MTDSNRARARARASSFSGLWSRPSGPRFRSSAPGSGTGFSCTCTRTWSPAPDSWPPRPETCKRPQPIIRSPVSLWVKHLPATCHPGPPPATWNGCIFWPT